ncbi:MAG: hypothetical protein CTY32_08330 [Methylotenera sp.]|nr:MAG: hypothetical protein CTY32_08330 [Methylotenera sp.]
MTNQVNQEAFEAWLLNNMWQVEHPNGDCETVLSNDDVRAYFKASESEINSLKQSVEELEEWKNEAIAVESEWDCQSVGKALNIQFGHSIRANILPKITALQADNLRLREALEHMVEGNVPEYDVNNYKKLLSTTTTQSLAEHDNEVTAPYKKALEFAEYMAKSTEQFMIAINHLDEADREEDEETVEILQEKRGEHWRAVNSSIYEFRQRSDRALKATP